MNLVNYIYYVVFIMSFTRGWDNTVSKSISPLYIGIKRLLLL
jgi:hypothetical protein